MSKLLYPGDAVAAIQSAEGLKTHFGAMASHPFNQHDPERSTWWLFPRGKDPAQVWPAFDLGKFLIDMPRGQRFRVGLHVEKGLARKHAQSYRPNYEMKPDWAWNRFLPAMTDGSLARALDTIGERTASAPLLDISGGYPKAEPVSLSEPSTEILFEWTGSGLAPRHCSIAKGKLERLDTVRSLDDLARHLGEASKTDPWTWVDFVVGAIVPPNTPEEVGYGSRVWNAVLEPLKRWVG